MIFRVHWTDVARADLFAILDYVEGEHGHEYAARLWESIVPAVDALQHHPQRGRIVPELARIGVERYRELLVGSYRVPFRIDRNHVVLVGVLDGRRDLQELLIERAFRR